MRTGGGSWCVGLLNTALPFWLLSWGETRIDSGVASIIQASVPIFIVLIAFGFFHEQRVTGSRLVGVVIGFVGVAVLVGAQPEGKILGAIAVVGMAALLRGGRAADAAPSRRDLAADRRARDDLRRGDRDPPERDRAVAG